MFPHAIGWFPMVAAWVIITAHLEQTKRDIALITDRKMPDWVDAVVRLHAPAPVPFCLTLCSCAQIYGTVLVHKRWNSNTHAPSNTTLACADLLVIHCRPGEKASQARPLACY